MIKKIFKNWVLGWKFVRDALRESEIQGSIDAFEKAREDVLETFQGDVEARAEELVGQKLIAMLSVVDPKSVVKYDKAMRTVFIGDVMAEAGRLANLHAEAEFFQQSDLWKLLYETPKELAQKAMFVSGEGLVDMQKGKSMLFTLSTQKNILDTFLSYTPKG